MRIYRALRLSEIEKIEIPGAGNALQLILRLVTVLPWFVQRQRTLDAWVLANRELARQSWLGEADAVRSEAGFEQIAPIRKEVYVPLPMRQGDPISGDQTMEPKAGDFRGMIAAPRTTIQIIGPGGAGKTTLARQVGQWALDNGPQSGIASHSMLPVWVDEEIDPTKNSLRDVVRGKLAAALPGEEIDDVLFSALLKKQRLLVFVDRLSERSAAMQRHVETIYRSTKIGLLVVTSRMPHRIDGAHGLMIYPQPLNSATLLRFMTALLAAFLTHEERSKPFATIEEQCGLGVRLAQLIRLRTVRGDEDVPLIPLPVRLFVEQAVQLVRAGKQLHDLPVSLPGVYFQHLRLVNPQDPGLPHFVANDRLVKVAKAIAKTALGGDFIPRSSLATER